MWLSLLYQASIDNTHKCNEKRKKINYHWKAFYAFSFKAFWQTDFLLLHVFMANITEMLFFCTILAKIGVEHSLGLFWWSWMISCTDGVHVLVVKTELNSFITNLIIHRQSYCTRVLCHHLIILQTGRPTIVYNKTLEHQSLYEIIVGHVL